MSTPATVATNIVAIDCMTTVPFMWMVIPVGNIRLVVLLPQPSSVSHVRMLTGRAAADEFVAEASIAVFAHFRMKGIGLSLQVTQIVAGYRMKNRAIGVAMPVKT